MIFRMNGQSQLGLSIFRIKSSTNRDLEKQSYDNTEVSFGSCRLLYPCDHYLLYLISIADDTQFIQQCIDSDHICTPFLAFFSYLLFSVSLGSLDLFV